MIGNKVFCYIKPAFIAIIQKPEGNSPINITPAAARTIAAIIDGEGDEKGTASSDSLKYM